jgi:hypothetical protein
VASMAVFSVVAPKRGRRRNYERGQQSKPHVCNLSTLVLACSPQLHPDILPPVTGAIGAP